MSVQPSTQANRAAAPSGDAVRLRHGLRALTDLLTRPSDAGEGAQGLLGRLADSVLTVLALDVIYLRWTEPDGQVREFARVRQANEDAPAVQTVRDVVAPWLPPRADRVEILDPWGKGTLALVPVAAGSHAALVLIAGSRRADFPDELEEALLHLAAAQAALALERSALESAVARERESRRKAEESERAMASRSGARKAAIVESALDAIVFIDHAGKIADFNAAAERTFGYSRAEAIGRDFADLVVHPSQRDRRGAELACHLLTDEAVLLGKRLEMPAYRADGKDFPAELAVTRLPTDGPPMFAGFLRDISERKWLEQILKQRAQELAEADRRKTEFLAMLAHELRNPLAPIRNGVDLLRRLGPAEPRLQQLQDIIDRQTAHMARLIDDLLDVSRVSRGKILLRRERLDAVELVQQTLQDHRVAMEGKDLTLAADLPPGPVWLLGDRTRLAQAVGNVLNNAVKFTPPGGRVAVRMAVEPDGQAVGVAVQDTGIGMEPEAVARVFEAFNQVDAARDEGQAGLGLGLALVKGLVELHGGTVTASSPGPGEGSTFTLRLPVAAAEEGEGDPPAEARPAGGPSRRVLVIEDKPDAAESMRLLLETFGHRVAVCHTGQAGLALAEEFGPEVVLCDIGLPKGMDGYAVARALRARGTRAYLIALTGYGQEEDQRRSREAGFDLHLTKPVDPRALERLLASLPPSARPQ